MILLFLTNRPGCLQLLRKRAAGENVLHQAREAVRGDRHALAAQGLPRRHVARGHGVGACGAVYATDTARSLDSCAQAVTLKFAISGPRDDTGHSAARRPVKPLTHAAPVAFRGRGRSPYHWPSPPSHSAWSSLVQLKPLTFQLLPPCRPPGSPAKSTLPRAAADARRPQSGG